MIKILIQAFQSNILNYSKKNEIKSELLIINANHSFEYIFNNKEAIELGKKLVN